MVSASETVLSQLHPTQIHQSAPSVIPTYAPRLLFASVTNATLALTAGGASSAALLVRIALIGCVFCRSDCSERLVTGISDAYYCAECTRLEKDRDGCPKIVNLGASRTDLFYERRRLGASLTLPLTYYELTHLVRVGFKKG